MKTWKLTLLVVLSFFSSVIFAGTSYTYDVVFSKVESVQPHSGSECSDYFPMHTVFPVVYDGKNLRDLKIGRSYTFSNIQPGKGVMLNANAKMTTFSGTFLTPNHAPLHTTVALHVVKGSTSWTGIISNEVCTATVTVTEAS